MEIIWKKYAGFWITDAAESHVKQVLFSSNEKKETGRWKRFEAKPQQLYRTYGLRAIPSKDKPWRYCTLEEWKQLQAAPPK